MNRKQKTEEFALNAIMYLVIIFLLSVFTFNLQAQVVTQDDLVIQNKESVFKKYMMIF